MDDNGPCFGPAKILDDGTPVMMQGPRPKCPQCGNIFGEWGMLSMAPQQWAAIRAASDENGEPGLMIATSISCGRCGYTLHCEPGSWWGETKEGQRQVLIEVDYLAMPDKETWVKISGEIIGMEATRKTHGGGAGWPPAGGNGDG